MRNTLSYRGGLIESQGLGAYNRARPASLTAKTGALEHWKTGTISYDPLGNITAMGPTLSGQTETFTYDPIFRLKEASLYVPVGSPVGASHEQRRQRFTYEAFGNLKKIETAIGAGAYVAQTIAIDSSTNRLSVPIYDEAGNQRETLGVASYSYDKLNQIRAVNPTSTNWTTFLYTADDERVMSLQWTGTVASVQETYTLRGLGNEVLTEYRNTGGTEGTWQPPKDYVYRGGQLLASLANQSNGTDEIRHYALDHLGSPRVVTNHLGQKLALHAYYPFGAEATSTAQDQERMKFTGHERDFLASGSTLDDLDYMHARHCSPQTGRFLSVDRGQSARKESPQTWNRYGYVMGNPIALVDPNGEAAVAVYVVPVVLVAVTVAVLHHTARMQTDDAYRETVLGLPGSFGPMFSKRTGRQIPSYLEGVPIEVLLEKLKTATGKERADLIKALKEHRERNKQKGRGGRREPKKPKTVGGADSEENNKGIDDFELGEIAIESLSAKFGLSLSDVELLLGQPSFSTLDPERLEVCGVGVGACPF